MLEPTIRECLMRQTKDELWQSAACLGLAPLKKNAKKAEWVSYIADALPEMTLGLYLQIRCEELEAIHELCNQGFLAVEQAMTEEAWAVADDACYALERYGLAWKTVKGWQIRQSVPELLPLDEEVRMRLTVHDVVYDMVEGLLIHVGMMPVETLLDEAVRMFRDVQGELEDESELRDMCMAVFSARRDERALWLDPEDTPWLLHPELEDPEGLWRRLREVGIRTLEYPSFKATDMVLAFRNLGLPGDMEQYDPLLDWIDQHCPEEEPEALLYDLVMMTENEHGSDSLGVLADCVSDVDMKTLDAGMQLLTDLTNSIPRWWNKGCSPKTLFNREMKNGHAKRQMPVRRFDDARMPVPQESPIKAPPMPGRNDPCTCGSGKKYKNCCGKRLN